jgi:hypothetical protein
MLASFAERVAIARVTGPDRISRWMERAGDVGLDLGRPGPSTGSRAPQQPKSRPEIALDPGLLRPNTHRTVRVVPCGSARPPRRAAPGRPPARDSSDDRTRRIGGRGDSGLAREHHRTGGVLGPGADIFRFRWRQSPVVTDAAQYTTRTTRIRLGHSIGFVPETLSFANLIKRWRSRGSELRHELGGPARAWPVLPPRAGGRGRR